MTLPERWATAELPKARLSRWSGPAIPHTYEPAYWGADELGARYSLAEQDYPEE